MFGSMPSCSVSGGRTQQRRSRGDDLITVLKSRCHHHRLVVDGSGGYLALLVLSRSSLHENVARGTFVKDRGCGYDELLSRGAGDGERGKHFGLEEIPR